VLLLAQACCIAARYPGVQILQRKDVAWTYDLRCFFPQFDRENIPLEQLIPTTEDMLTTLMGYHPEMLESIAESREKLRQEATTDK
jgi:hypothetical protein